MVHTDSKRLVLIPQQGHQGLERLTDALTDGGKFLGAELLAVRIWLIKNEQAGIDPDFVDVLGDLQGDLDAVVVNIRHQGNGAAALTKLLTDLSHRLGVGHRGGRHPHDLTARFRQADDAGYSSLDIEGVLVDHRLHHDRVLAAHGHITHHHSAGHTAVDLGVVAPIQGSHGAGGEARQRSHSLRRTASRSCRVRSRGAPAALEGLRSR